MKAFAVTNLMVALVCAVSAPAGAQDSSTARPQTTATPSIEVTPFVSIDSRGSTPIGAAVTFPLRSNVALETEVGYRRGEGQLKALSSSANLLYSLPRIGRATPYVATGAGLAQFGAPIVSGQGAVIGTEPRTAFEVNAGGGLKVPVTESWGMRSDARWFKSFGKNASEHWRVSNGVSFDVGQR